MPNYTHFCVTEKGDIYVLDVEARTCQQAHVPLVHILLEHRTIPELSLRAVRLMGFPI